MTVTAPNPNRQRSGQMGGLQTRMRYGDAYLRELGKRGGRPRLPNIEQLRQQQSAIKKENEKNGGLDPRRSLERLLKHR
jgi:hypothetical protein